jgi:hypothetical protein
MKDFLTIGEAYSPQNPEISSLFAIFWVELLDPDPADQIK